MYFASYKPVKFTKLIENLEYNTIREELIIPEYGRHIQKMINYASSRESKEERNKLANSIISVMGNLQPHLRDCLLYTSDAADE